MQYEIKLFEEVKSVHTCWYQGAKNLYGKTPDEVFLREHHKMTKEAKEWAKETARSYILAAALIVTIMFALRHLQIIAQKSAFLVYNM
ncbi:hypothetical protein SLA2020_243760 [Shorea laevis]